uniref:CCHC-type domain-containing protein n=1 Tax=Chenopodium quinoa TaxID=63459 RepID=A0A803M810_CHEQI
MEALLGNVKNLLHKAITGGIDQSPLRLRGSRITYSDFSQSLVELGISGHLRGGLNDEVVTEMWERIDANGDGIVDVPDFLRAWTLCAFQHANNSVAEVKDTRNFAATVEFVVKKATLLPREVEDGTWPDDYVLSDHAYLTVEFAVIVSCSLMAEELSKRWEKLRITNDEEDVAVLEKTDSDVTENNIDLTLVGKVLSMRPYNFEAMQNTLKKRDREKILKGAPWIFDNNLVLLKEINGSEQPESIELKLCPFWIRLYNLPLDCRSNRDVKTIAEKVGYVMEIEDDWLGWDRSRRARVLVDTTKPIRRVQKIRDKEGQDTFVQFKYERLPNLCFTCGILGHTEKDCPNEDEGEEGEEKQWGMWLKASPRKGLSLRKEEIEKLQGGRKLVFTHKPRTGKHKGAGDNTVREGSDVGSVEEMQVMMGNDVARKKQDPQTLEVSTAIHEVPDQVKEGGKRCEFQSIGNGAALDSGVGEENVEDERFVYNTQKDAKDIGDNQPGMLIRGEENEPNVIKGVRKRGWKRVDKTCVGYFGDLENKGADNQCEIGKKRLLGEGENKDVSNWQGERERRRKMVGNCSTGDGVIQVEADGSNHPLERQ